ncbi:MAG: hypothetical protein IT441_07930 [Phycisphaeraceae bacterium]|nr:hypothetical protein [Phycisphaeraceae bacterium]
MTYRVREDISMGNAADVHIDAASSPPTIAFSAHPHGGPEAIWFHFRLERDPDASPPGNQIRLLLRHYLSLAYTHPDLTANIRPVIRTPGTPGSDWQRLDAPQRIDLPDGQIDLAWIISSPPPGGSLEIALCPPYGPAEVEQLITDTHGYWHTDTIGVTPAGRPLTRLSNRYGSPPGSDEPRLRPPGAGGIFLIARQHAGETPGSWVLDGLLRELAQAGDRSPLTWVIPLADLDATLEGDYGKDRFPYDLNRAWGHPPMRHEALLIQRDMRRWAQRCTPILALDFHAPGPCEDTGVYCYPPDEKESPNLRTRVDPWLARFREALGDYAAENFARTGNYRSRWETPTFCDFAGHEFNSPALAIETCYALADRGRIVMTPHHYQQIGRRLAQAIL